MAARVYAAMGLVALSIAAAGAAAADGVVDGDTFELEGQPIRLYGIDAFELGQTCLDARGNPWRCGVAAKATLAERVRGSTLSCTVMDEDRSGGYVARCETADGEDLGAYLVVNGLALADPGGAGAYAEQERTARATGAGAWSGTFMPPWQWREQ